MHPRCSLESSRSKRPHVVTALVAALVLAWSLPASAASGPEPIVLRGAESLPPSTPTVFNGDLRDLPTAREWQPGDPIKEVPRRHHFPPRLTPPPAAPQIDPLLAVQAGSRSPESLGPPILNFAGQGFTGVNPPDTVGDVGLDHFVQAINGSGGARFTVYNKADGTVAAGPINMETLGTGGCATGVGDPVVLYDQLADRWFLSEFSGAVDALCVYISQTSNPVSGGWFAYQFNTPGFPDYPKYGVWPDAYYASSNESSPAAYAFDRAQMLVGGVATAQRFTATDLGAFGFQALIPADADGETPPPVGAPNPYMRHRDDEAHNPPGTPLQDFLEIWEFHVDWVTPGNSTFTGPINIPITEIDSELCGFTSFNCFPQQGSGTTLDPLREVVMNRLQYRNFGTHQTLVSNLVTDVDGTNHGGIRWFELRNTGSGWSVHQEGTYAPDIHHRWMGSAAMDGGGNLAVGYSVSSTTMFPSIRYAGRDAADTLGTLDAEFTAIAGTAANGSNRWGDYSALSVDPVDDSTFWFTTMYSPASSWATRIVTFSVCDPPGAPTIGTATAAAANRIDVTWTNGAPASSSFNVYRADGTCAAPGPFVKIGNSVPGFLYQDTTVSGGSTYAYRVTGLLTGCESDASGCVDATATGACTLGPLFAGLQTVTNPATSTCSLDLAWTAGTSRCTGGSLTYKVHRSTTPGFTPGPANQIAAGLTGTTFQDGGPLTSGQSYEYVVRATETVNSIEETNTVRRSGTPTGPFIPGSLNDTFESVAGGGFDNPGWSRSALSGAINWVWSTAQSHTPTHSWYSQSANSPADRVLTSPPFTAQASTTLSFFHTFDFEFSSGTCWDGGTLEFSSNGGPWTVMPDGNFTAGLFTGTVGGNSGNPLQGKRAWCDGNIGAMTQVTVNLGSFNGQPLRLRWHGGEDANTFGTGWFVDTVNIANALIPTVCSQAPGYHSVVPCRLVDTRGAAAPALLPNSLRTFDLNAACGIPTSAKALSINVTATEATASGHLTLFAADIAEPGVSSINFNAGQTRANNGVLLLPLAGQGDVTVRNASPGTVHLIVDVNGYFE